VNKIQSLVGSEALLKQDFITRPSLLDYGVRLIVNGLGQG